MEILKKTGMKAWRKANGLGRDGTIRLLKEKGLTGRGGACFLTGMKWELCKKAKGDERFLICNADEGEPGTFKDKLILEKNPDNVIEGMLIAAYCIGARQAYIYLRGEYYYLKGGLERSVKKASAESGSDIRIDVIEGAGAYVCGDETAIIASIENKRGYPHFKPPYPPQKGLFGKPTVINNVETLANVPLAILEEGWRDDVRLFSISGDAAKAGVYEIKTGAKLEEIAKMAGAKNIKAVYFGASGGCIPYNSEFRVDAEHICKEDAMLGACSLIFAGRKRSMLDMAINIAGFFKHESCGKCTPCREGNVHVLRILERIKEGKEDKESLELLERLAVFIKDNSLCGLGQSCTNHVLTALKYFKGDFMAKGPKR
ncbi:NADH-quinone oxidoreductase subunit F [Candidatus Woesearchaeota archaeon]|nr:NADH-quinone oxidoreductase subunit F [Candidatus Woesearchaeota archaeon]